MIRYLVDHCFDEDFLRAAERQAANEESALDAVLARNEGLASAKDEEVLAWAADHDRVVLTHDRNTLIGIAHERTRSGLPMPASSWWMIAPRKPPLRKTSFS